MANRLHLLLLAGLALVLAGLPRVRAAAAAAAGKARSEKIKTVVVLMLENRSFDHYAGWLKQSYRSDVRGLRGDEWNPSWLNGSSSERHTVTKKGSDVTLVDPGHSIPTTAFQIYGEHYPPRPEEQERHMKGFVHDYALRAGAEEAPTIMDCLDERLTPAFHSLAQEFGLFDDYYCSMPGNTMPNRLFYMTGTSWGHTKNNIPQIIAGYPQKSIFESLEESGLDWKAYFQLVPSSIILKNLRTLPRLLKFRFLDSFFKDAAEGVLPDFVFLDPSFYPLFDRPATDQHPPHRVTEGERLIKQVYEALRASPQWNNTLFLLTWDEHGGYMDFGPPPARGVPNPDGRNAEPPEYPFDFRRLGIRVPLLAISPWIPKGTLIHEPTDAQKPTSTSAFEHASILHTVKDLFNLDSFLTKRDAWAASFADIVDDLDEPRTDCPRTLPDIPPMSPEDLEWEKARPMYSSQKMWIELWSSLSGLAIDEERFGPGGREMNQGEGGQFVHKAVREYFARHSADNLGA